MNVLSSEVYHGCGEDSAAASNLEVSMIGLPFLDNVKHGNLLFRFNCSIWPQ
jgi:hypothetical protein